MMMLVDEFGTDEDIANAARSSNHEKTEKGCRKKDIHHIRVEKREKKVAPLSHRHKVGLLRRKRIPDEPLKNGSKTILETQVNFGGNGSQDHDIIVIDDDEDVPLKCISKRFAPESPTGPKELCVYHRQVVTEHDYKTLGEEQYLNDAIINFYLTYLYENLPVKEKQIVHIYSSHFYSRLKGSGSKKLKSGPASSQAERCYERVKSWTKKIDIFDKRMLIFPICEEEHWYLIIVCNPGLVLSQKRNQDFEKAREKQQKREGEGSNPFLMILDSLDGTHSTALNKIRNYLQFEHLEKKKFPLTFGRDKMDEKHPKIPLQPNSCDCGVFLLHYVQLIFKDIYKFLGAKLPDLSRWFTDKEIDLKRYDIALILRELADKAVKFPHIKFPAVRSRRDDPRLKNNSRDESQDWRRPRTPPYPPPPTDSEGESSPSPPPSKKVYHSVKDCLVVTKKLDYFEGSNPKFFRHSKRKHSPSSGSVITSKSEMFKELMKNCK